MIYRESEAWHAEHSNFLVVQKMQLKLGYSQNAKDFVSALQT